eukprot:TRINITY_DN74690_c0_g1_i1.p1 TRINITY_DN74690_c0_g1~~TRINITY_DN74690_c0_g1_i1.p1  ORF type:complete len:113 (-),score=27.50 TRINITY_DN74690_c0_g1_i1:109-447(-)
MEPILAANCKAVAARQDGRGTSFEKTKLQEQKRLRGGLSFLSRMEADTHSKHAFQQVCSLRQQPATARALDNAVERLKGEPELDGPKIVTHSSKLLYSGQDRKINWAPLEYY